MRPKHMAFIAAAASIALWTLQQGLAPSPSAPTSSPASTPAPLVSLPQRTSTPLSMDLKEMSLGGVDIMYQINAAALNVDNAQALTSPQFRQSLQELITSSVDASITKRPASDILQDPQWLASDVGKELQERLNKQLGSEVLVVDQINFSKLCGPAFSQCLDVALDPRVNLQARRSDYPSDLPRPDHFLEDLSNTSKRITP